MPDKETAHLIRGLAARAQVTAANDDGQTQTVNAKIYEGVERSDIEVVQPFGFSSRAPTGGLGIVVAIGGDQGDLVMFPVSDPASRLGGLEDGETVLYNSRGDRVHLKEDGTIEITSGKETKIKVGDMTIEVDGQGKKVRCMAGDGGPRFVATDQYVKISAFGNAISIIPGGIFSTVPVVIGPEPDPGT